LCRGRLGRAKRFTPLLLARARICGSFTIFKSIRTVDLLRCRRARFCRPMRKARESSMALVVWRLVLALVLSFCAVAVIAPRQAPAADVIEFLEADAAAGRTLNGTKRSTGSNSVTLSGTC
jgi:hypothetical protein